MNSNIYSKIKTRTLDSFNLKNLSLIKIDVQGWEKKVLRGAKKTIKSSKPLLIVDLKKHQLIKENTSVEELILYIKKLDYHIFYLEFSYPSDHICVHKSELKQFKSKYKNYIFSHKDNNPINENLKYGILDKIKVL